MSDILGPDGMPATRERGMFGPSSLDELPHYEEGHWAGLEAAAKAIFEERMTVPLSTPMALLRADFLGLAVNSRRVREENARLREALQALVSAAQLGDAAELGRARAAGEAALAPETQEPEPEPEGSSLPPLPALQPR